MSTKIASALAAGAIALSLGVVAPPVASAAPAAVTPTQGLAICFWLPVGSASIGWCL